MKVTIVLVALFAVTYGSVIGTRESDPLFDDLMDFVKLLPKEIPELMKNYANNDPEVHEAYMYIISEEQKQYLLTIEQIEEFKELLRYLQSQGVNAVYIYKKLHELFGMPPFEPPMIIRTAVKGEGMEGMYQEIEALLPLDKIKALHDEKMLTSPAYKTCVEVLQSKEYEELVEAAASTEEYQTAVQIPLSHHVDSNRYGLIVSKIFGLDL